MYAWSKLATGNVVIYDLAGRRVEKMEKGIYIVNGKKVVIKWVQNHACMSYAERE